MNKKLIILIIFRLWQRLGIYVYFLWSSENIQKAFWGNRRKRNVPLKPESYCWSRVTSRWRNNPFYREEEDFISRKSPKMESFSLLINSPCTKCIKSLLAFASKPITESCINCVRVMIRPLYTMPDSSNQKGSWLPGPIPVFNNQGDWGLWPWANDSGCRGDENPGHTADSGIPWLSNVFSHPNIIFAQSPQFGVCIGSSKSEDTFQLMLICRDSSVLL